MENEDESVNIEIIEHPDAKKEINEIRMLQHFEKDLLVEQRIMGHCIHPESSIVLESMHPYSKEMSHYVMNCLSCSKVFVQLAYTLKHAIESAQVIGYKFSINLDHAVILIRKLKRCFDIDMTSFLRSDGPGNHSPYNLVEARFVDKQTQGRVYTVTYQSSDLAAAITIVALAAVKLYRANDPETYNEILRKV